MIKEERNRKQSLALVLLVIATLCTVFLMTRDVPVSYTHLDVYKRQPWRN